MVSFTSSEVLRRAPLLRLTVFYTCSFLKQQHFGSGVFEGVVCFGFYLPMFTVCERGSSRRGRGINELGLYWIFKRELLAAYIIFSRVLVPSGSPQKYFFVIYPEISAFLSVSLVSS